MVPVLILAASLHSLAGASTAQPPALHPEPPVNNGLDGRIAEAHYNVGLGFLLLQSLRSIRGTAGSPGFGLSLDAEYTKSWYILGVTASWSNLSGAPSGDFGWRSRNLFLGLRGAAVLSSGTIAPYVGAGFGLTSMGQDEYAKVGPVGVAEFGVLFQHNQSWFRFRPELLIQLAIPLFDTSNVLAGGGAPRTWLWGVVGIRLLIGK